MTPSDLRLNGKCKKINKFLSDNRTSNYHNINIYMNYLTSNYNSFIFSANIKRQIGGF